jgi:hypothetical protein
MGLRRSRRTRLAVDALPPSATWIAWLASHFKCSMQDALALSLPERSAAFHDSCVAPIVGARVKYVTDDERISPRGLARRAHASVKDGLARVGAREASASFLPAPACARSPPYARGWLSLRAWKGRIWMVVPARSAGSRVARSRRPCGPSQIRTCGTTASGSSGYGFAAPGKRGLGMWGNGSGYRSSSLAMRCQVMRARCERRLSHLRHASSTA